LRCYPPGGLDMNRMKGLPSVLDVEADRIDYAVNAGKRIRN
jgi:hypothetical protein